MKKKILFLYSHMVPSWMPVFQELVINGSVVDVIHWDKKSKTPYIPSNQDGVTFHPRSKFNQEMLNAHLYDFNPDLIFISGWMDKGYLLSAFRARKNDIPVIFGCDDWWTGSLRQRMASFIPQFLRQSVISHAWVSGPRQYEYCKRLGFCDDEIVFNFLTCDTNNFSSKNMNNNHNNKNQFLYVGRFSQEKGIKTLVNGFNYYIKELEGTWGLTCIGNGPLKNVLTESNNIEVLEFMSPEGLSSHFSDSGAFVLPSDRDFSPLVVHEATSAGKPLILSSNVGNAATFAIHKFNSLIFTAMCEKSLGHAFKKMEDYSIKERSIMGSNSLKLSLRNTPEIAAASLETLL
ncbi:MAG: glycosyltransferase family 4 protein [Methylophilaceae bacterium]|jgi:glycosyltransferase involved in cell wall biosynthesis|nr:glycosyltransferase family 4 protein [Methylophilaceae bacterium]